MHACDALIGVLMLPQAEVWWKSTLIEILMPIWALLLAFAYVYLK